MPGRDQTGPMGQGAMTGRRMGNCLSNNDVADTMTNQFADFGRWQGRRGWGRGNGRGYNIGYRRRWWQGYGYGFAWQMKANWHPSFANAQKSTIPLQSETTNSQELKQLAFKLEQNLNSIFTRIDNIEKNFNVINNTKAEEK
ncbi:MAG: DUF5320 domain-containing protein [Deltaproteobacteria bacterium]|nr:DUF5320 domain-containing protein [Deltaproteobacteria bacterium]